MASIRLFRAVALASLLSFGYAQDRTSVEEQSAITDPAEQCRPYNYPPLAGQSVNFPPVWATATILPNDAAARAKWDEISPGIPNIASKGNITETFQTYDARNDPDCWWTATECTKPKVEGIPEDLSMVPPPQTLGYGFDDGPNCSHNAFYDYLTSQNQKATMFFIGSNVYIWPLQAKRALEDGHELCVHTWSHQAMTGLSSEQAFAEMWYTVILIKLVAGVTPTCFRPPLGDTDDRIRYISDSLGLRTVLWKYDTRDTIPGPSGIVDPADVDKNYEDFLRVAESGAFANEGAILLAHETNNMTMSQAIKYYPRLKQAFKVIAPVAVCLNNTQPYVEPDYSMPTFEQYVGGTTETDGPASENPSTLTNTRSASGPTSTANTSGRSGENNENSAGTLLVSTFFALPAFLVLVL
ncbi:carbohydrate esterase family 4 protein [Moniliophthora roreri MCA 2997]|uniref:chitin deacetylase n=1 Tax=Moniliophthora roreri (strain MCA 2997) TaxID=1381753 RepID=V2X592_MONRO|nr:carbohydrate esterase family 4 protein [Moniliophthora roreri MCA 2997]